MATILPTVPIASRLFKFRAFAKCGLQCLRALGATCICAPLMADEVCGVVRPAGGETEGASKPGEGVGEAIGGGAVVDAVSKATDEAVGEAEEEKPEEQPGNVSEPPAERASCILAHTGGFPGLEVVGYSLDPKGVHWNIIFCLGSTSV